MIHGGGLTLLEASSPEPDEQTPIEVPEGDGEDMLRWSLQRQVGGFACEPRGHTACQQ
jgi:hypothetical protein